MGSRRRRCSAATSGLLNPDPIRREGEEIVIQVCGNGFLYNMVRIIVGTLMEAGRGVFPPEHVKEILEARDRRYAGPTAPACGLTLIRYEF